MQKVVLAACLFFLSAQVSQAQADRFVHYDCMAGFDTPQSGSMKAPRRLSEFVTQWDSARTYPVAVVLLTFSDREFSMDDPVDRYNRIFNEKGYNEGKGAGCVADYFATQSGGLFKPRFDVMGPYKLKKASTKYDTYGRNAFREAMQFIADSTSTDFSIYDWDGDGSAEPVVFVYAGFGGNEVAHAGQGYIWPNTSSMSSTVVGDTRVAAFSASSEMWSSERLCGVGTVCHEFAHTLGLPDLYPVNDSDDEFSVCDEWDLMDGGNYTNNGWCPPNFSALEKMLLGWATPVELTEPTVVTGMKSVAQQGTVYKINTTDKDEFFLLENRQWEGWDLRSPGHGLLIAHVHYSKPAWNGNSVNIVTKHHRYDLVHADNRDYNAWESIIGYSNPYKSGHSQFLSGTAYPYVTDSTTTNNALTDTTVPAATTFTGSGLLSKPITNITEDADGTISFTFMADVHDAITTLADGDESRHMHYDLQGRHVEAGALRPGLYVRNGRKVLIK